MSVSFNDLTATLSFSCRGPRCLVWSFLSFLLRKAAVCVKFGTNRLKTLQKPINEQSSVRVAG